MSSSRRDVIGTIDKSKAVEDFEEPVFCTNDGTGLTDPSLDVEGAAKRGFYTSTLSHKSLLLAALVALMLTTTLIGLAGISSIQSGQDLSSGPLAYAPHARILINGDADFDSQGWPGKGTLHDPYIIEGLDIDGLDWHNAILIGNTTVYFTIRDCYLHNSFEAGVLLWNVAHGELLDNNCSVANYYGVYVYDSGDISVTNVTGGRMYVQSHSSVVLTNNNGNEISVVSSTSASLSGNNCSSISVQSSGPVSLTDNACLNGATGGMSVSSPDQVTVTNNNGSYSGQHPLTVSGGADCVVTNNFGFVGVGNDITVTVGTQSTISYNSGTIVVDAGARSIISHNSGEIWVSTTGSTVSYNNGSGVGIVLSGSGNAVTQNAGPLTLNSADSNTVTYNNCSYGPGSGIILVDSSDNTVSNNNCSNNAYGSGISLVSSQGNALANNICLNNLRGISIESSAYTNLTGNNCSYDSREGISIMDSYYTKLRSTAMFDDGIFLSGSSLQTWGLQDIDSSNLVNGRPVHYVVDQIGGRVPDGKGQVILVNCRGVLLENQNLSRASYGITMAYCSQITAANNTCSDEYGGIYLILSNDNTLTNNTCTRNNAWGITLDHSNYTTASGNNCSNNAGNGIRLMWSNGNILTRNTCDHNLAQGILLSQSSTENAVDNNTCSLNMGEGIGLTWFSGYNVLDNNTCNGEAGNGILVTWGCDRNVVRSNNCSFNLLCGIEFDRSGYNKVTWNWFIDNGLYGVFLDDNTFSHDQRFSIRNLFYGNTFIDNNGASSVFDPYHKQASDIGWYNYWNAPGYGNYWSDWQSPDDNHDSIVDAPYEITKNGRLGADGPMSYNATDWYPLTGLDTEPIPEFSNLTPMILVAAMALLICGLRVVRRKT